MATFILIHGSWHGGWCWTYLTPLLTAAGHRVLTPDLPAHGDDQTPAEARPWENVVPFVVQLAGQQADPVILVGHSSGGIVISQVARVAPSRVAALVYLAGFLLPHGMTTDDVMADDQESLLKPAIEADANAGLLRIRPDAIRAALFHDCAESDVEWATGRLRPEFLHSGSRVEPAPPTPSNRRIPKIYIEALQDRAIPLSVQRRMQSLVACDAVYALDTSHSPFFSAPEPLAGLLSDIASRFGPPGGTRPIRP